jgi:hypothetical protein
VTTEEGVLNAIIRWASIVDHIHDWREATQCLQDKSLEEVFGDRIASLSEVLNYVRFALMPPPLLVEVSLVPQTLLHPLNSELRKLFMEIEINGLFLVFSFTDAILLPF